MARVIYAEADTKGAEIRTSALVMLNRPGSTKGNAYRNPLLSILTEFGEIKDGFKRGIHPPDITSSKRRLKSQSPDPPDDASE